MLSLYSLKTDDFSNNFEKILNLQYINSDIILNIDNRNHIVTVTYGADIKTFLSNIYSNYNENMGFAILSKNNCIKLYGEIENEDKLIVLLDNKLLVKYTINVLAITDAKNFQLLDFHKNSNLNLKILFDNSTSEFLLGKNNFTTINGNVVLSGYLTENQIINFNNIIVSGNLFLNIYLGHINLNNIKAKNIIILSAGSKSVSFKGNSSVNNITVLTKKPVKINAEGTTNIKNVNLSPTGDSLNKNRIILDGTFFNTDITIKSPLILEGRNNLQIYNPIHIQNNNSNDEIKFTGDFENVKNVLVEKPVVILGDIQKPPKNLNIEIITNSFNEAVFLKNNLSLSNILISKNSSIVCNGAFNTINVMGPEEVFLQLDTGTTINDFNCYTIVKVNGTEDAINDLVDNSHIYDEGDIIIDTVFKTIYFKDGHGITNTTISKPGTFDISLKVKQGNETVTLSKKINVKIH